MESFKVILMAMAAIAVGTFAKIIVGKGMAGAIAFPIGAAITYLVIMGTPITYVKLKELYKKLKK